MNKNNNLNSDLPDMTHSFVLDEVGKISKKRFVGDFKCKIPNTKEQCFIAKHQAFLNGEFVQYLDFGVTELHRKIAFLRFTLIEYPKFWRDSDLGYELLDHNIIDVVYEKVLEFEKQWLKEVWGDEYVESENDNDQKD